MKKTILIICAVVLVSAVVAVVAINGNGAQRSADNRTISALKGIDETSSQTKNDNSSDTGSSVTSGENGTTDVTYDEIDVDLTSMSSTVVYTQVYRMISYPEDFVGKVVKMRGNFSAYYGGATKLYYPAVIIPDATACCSQGIEFVLNGSPAYPDGYPTLGNEITVVGKFETYYEGTSRYCHLVNSYIV